MLYSLDYRTILIWFFTVIPYPSKSKLLLTITSSKESPFFPSVVILSPFALLKVTLILKINYYNYTIILYSTKNR